MKKKIANPLLDEDIAFTKSIIEARELAEKKAVDLSALHKKNVYPLFFVRPSTKDIFIGYISEPTRAAKMEAFDIMSSKESITLAGEIILATSLLKDESHEAFSSLDSKYDDVFLGGCIDAAGHVKLLLNTLKKK
ncbi:MAG: hypothetical protein V4538_16260 [Bacteroidota bacterium]